MVSHRYPNNTNIEKTNLNNVNRASREEAVENFKEEIKEKTGESKEDINDIRRKIKESLEENGKRNFIEPKNSGIEKNIRLEGKDSINSVVGKYPVSKRYRLRENDTVAKEIAEVLEDRHSLGAFRAVVDKIPEQQLRIFLSIIKDTYLTGRIKKSRGAMFISLAKDYAEKNNINLNFR